MAGPNGEFDPDDYVWPLPEATKTEIPVGSSALTGQFQPILGGQAACLPNYLADVRQGSKAMDAYEQAAKKSARLKIFQDTSPAGIEYFQS